MLALVNDVVAQVGEIFSPKLYGFLAFHKSIEGSSIAKRSINEGVGEKSPLIAIKVLFLGSKKGFPQYDRKC